MPRCDCLSSGPFRTVIIERSRNFSGRIKQIMKKLISVLLLAAMLVTLLASCGSSLKEDEKGATVKLYMGNEILDFDPAIGYTDDSTAKFLGLVYEGLTRINSQGKVEYALMDEYEEFEEIDEEDPSNNKYWIEIKLKETAWSDGRIVMADDVVYAWKRVLDPEFSCDAASLLFDIKNARLVKSGDVSVDDLGLAAIATDIVKVEFDTKIDYDLFFENVASLALVPLREDVVARNEKLYKLGEGDPFGRKATTMCSNGPFAVKGMDEGVLLRLERNAYYYRDLAADEALDKYVTPYRLLISYESEDYNMTIEEFSEKLFDEGEIYYLGAFSGVESAKKYEKDAVVTDLLSTHTYIFNIENPLFADANVRRALSMAIDREYIAKELVYYADAATGLVPSPVYDKKVGDSFRENGGALISTTADLAGAKALLGGKTGSFTISYMEGRTAEAAIAEYCAEQWRQLGFDVSVSAESINPRYERNYVNKLASGDYDIAAIDYQSQSTDSFGVLAPFATAFSGKAVVENNFEPVSYIRGYENEAYNELIETAFAEKDRAKRSETLHAAEKLLMEEMPIMPIIFNKDAYVINDTVNKVGSYYYGYRNFNDTKVKGWRDIESEEAALDSAANA